MNNSKATLAMLIIVTSVVALNLFSRFKLVRVASQSMMSTCAPGDIILVKKIGNFFGMRSMRIERNNIIVFNHPLDHDKKLIKRCIGLPGDKVEIRKSNVLVNGKPLFEPLTIRKAYEIKITPDSSGFEEWLDSFNIEFIKTLNSNTFLYLSHNERHDLCHKFPNLLMNQFFDTVSNSQIKSDSKDVFWSIDNYGPITIPKENFTISLTSENIKLFAFIIKKFEGHEIDINDDSIIIDNVVTKYYTFKKNYYFVLGDNRYSSNDSRFFGVFPYELIEGRAIFPL